MLILTITTTIEEKNIYLDSSIYEVKISDDIPCRKEIQMEMLETIRWLELIIDILNHERRLPKKEVKETLNLRPTVVPALTK